VQFHSPFEGAWADPETIHTILTGEWRLQRPVMRETRCSHCGLCFLFCPNGCVRDRGRHFEADLDFCKGCGLCARVCPVAAVTMVEEEGA